MRAGARASRERAQPSLRRDVTSASRALGEAASGVTVGDWKEGKRRRRQPVGTETDTHTRTHTHTERDGNPRTGRFDPVTQRSVTQDVGRTGGDDSRVAFSGLTEQPWPGDVNTAAVSIES